MNKTKIFAPALWIADYNTVRAKDGYLTLSTRAAYGSSKETNFNDTNFRFGYNLAYQSRIKVNQDAFFANVDVMPSPNDPDEFMITATEAPNRIGSAERFPSVLFTTHGGTPEILVRDPAKASAAITTIFDRGRTYILQVRDFTPLVGKRSEVIIRSDDDFFLFDMANWHCRRLNHQDLRKRNGSQLATWLPLS